jgi:hypothetical protein
MNSPISICDKIRSANSKIRHVGYYDNFGRILYDSIRPNTPPMEGTEEMHILNGTIASTLNLWDPATPLIGRVQTFIMIREKLTALAHPHMSPNEKGKYFLIVFESGISLSEIGGIRSLLDKELE